MEFDSDRESVHSEEQLSGETEMKTAEEEVVAGESALKESIRKKGQNSYYYAHGNTSNAPAWDGNSEPRLLHKTVSTEQAPRVEAITSYAWADGKKQVSIYVDYPEAAAVEDELIDLKFTETSLNFTIRVSQNLNKSLIIPRLHDAVTDVAVRKKADKFVLVLKKKTEFTWYDLKKAL